MADKDYWTWTGKYLGYRDADNLFTYRGRFVGKFHGEEVYGADGRYLGEEKSEGRLITNIGKRSWTKSSSGRASGSLHGKYANYAAYAMYAGHEDFPGPEVF